jgi:hypothetical protein
MNSCSYRAEAEPAARLQAQAFLRRHAVAAAAHFAAEAQVEIEDEALALIAEFMIAVTLTDVPESVSPLPHAVMATARLLFARDELKVARAEVRKEGSVDGQDARERTVKAVARFFAEVETGWSIGSGDQTLKAIQGRRIWSADYATGMRRLIAAWQKRRRRERQVAEALEALNLPLTSNQD